MGAQGSQSSVAIREETTWGEVDTGQFDLINFISESLAFSIENQSSNNVRPDRQTADLVQVSAECAGGIETEFQAANLDKLLPGALWDTNWHYINGSDNTGITAGATSSNLDFDITAASNLIVLGSSVSHNIVVGQYIITAGFTNAANNGAHLVTAVSTNNITVATTTLVDETAESTATIKGDRLRNGVTRHSYSIERQHNDISQFFLYKGMVPNVLDMTVESGEPISANLSFVGKDEVLNQVTTSSPAAASASTFSILNAVVSVGEIAIDGTALSACLIQSLSFSLDNKAEGKTGVGVLGFCDVNGKSIELTGNLSLYFNDDTYYDKYTNATFFSIHFLLTDAEGNSYLINIPKAKFSEATANVTGKDDDVMLDTGFTAIVGVNGFTIEVIRALA